MRSSGKKPRGKEPKAPVTGPKAKDQINLTDEESRIMPSADCFVQGYNAHAAVDVDSMLVIATTLTQQTNDKQQVEPMLSELKILQDSFGKPETLLADNGYFSNNNIQACVKQKITPLIALGRKAHHQPLEQCLTPDAPRYLKPLTRWSKWPGNCKPRVVVRFTANAKAPSNPCLGSSNRGLRSCLKT